MQYADCTLHTSILSNPSTYLHAELMVDDSAGDKWISTVARAISVSIS